MISPIIVLPLGGPSEFFFLLCRFFIIRKGALEDFPRFRLGFALLFSSVLSENAPLFTGSILILFVTSYAMLCQRWNRLDSWQSY